VQPAQTAESSYCRRRDGWVGIVSSCRAGGRTEGWPIKGAMKHVDYVSGVVVEETNASVCVCVCVCGRARRGGDGLNGYRLLSNTRGGGENEDKWKV